MTTAKAAYVQAATQAAVAQAAHHHHRRAGRQEPVSYTHLTLPTKA